MRLFTIITMTIDTVQEVYLQMRLEQAVRTRIHAIRKRLLSSLPQPWLLASDSQKQGRILPGFTILCKFESLYGIGWFPYDRVPLTLSNFIITH